MEILWTLKTGQILSLITLYTLSKTKQKKGGREGGKKIQREEGKLESIQFHGNISENNLMYSKFWFLRPLWCGVIAEGAAVTSLLSPPVSGVEVSVDGPDSHPLDPRLGFQGHTPQCLSPCLPNCLQQLRLDYSCVPKLCPVSLSSGWWPNTLCQQQEMNTHPLLEHRPHQSQTAWLPSVWLVPQWPSDLLPESVGNGKQVFDNTSVTWIVAFDKN